MLSDAKEIVIALINSGQICQHAETSENIDDVKTAIKEIYQELQNCRFIEPNSTKQN